MLAPKVWPSKAECVHLIRINRFLPLPIKLGFWKRASNYGLCDAQDVGRVACRDGKDVQRICCRCKKTITAAGGFGDIREPCLPGDRFAQEFLNEAARICAASLNVPFCKILRYRSEKNDLLIEAGCGWDSNIIGRVVLPADASTPQGRAYITGKPVIINATNDLSLPAFYGQHGIVATVDVLIKGSEGPSYGILEVDSPTPHAYDEHDIGFLTGFASVLAEAVAAQRGRKP